MKVAENNLINLITMLKNLGHYVPLYMSQVITSHTVAPIRKHLFTLLTQSDEQYKGGTGIAPEDGVHLSSSFGGFVDITKFPPIYLDIPYRKRILRHLATAVAGEAILQETLTHPGDLSCLLKRIKALAKMGVPLADFLQDEPLMSSDSTSTPTVTMFLNEEEAFNSAPSIGTVVGRTITATPMSEQAATAHKWADLLFEIPIGEDEEDDLFNFDLTKDTMVDSAKIELPASGHDTAVSERWGGVMFEIPLCEEEEVVFDSKSTPGSMVDPVRIETSI
ncbi:hypothetical protein [Legionella donaldsonii]|uniref:hypothetical protein n=1 Tax=Legionella donaldsonii TaxID=45060 RepID=UPI00399C5D31